MKVIMKLSLSNGFTSNRLLAIIVLFWTIAVMVQPAVANPTVTEVASQLICDCPDCGAKTLDQCPTCGKGQSYRDEIARLLTQGRSQQEILDTFANKYGEHMLATPRNKGIGLVAIVGPFVLLGMGLIPVVGVLRRRRIAPVETPRREKQIGGEDSEDSDVAAALRNFDF